ncbi:hypothetical protein J4558_12450 [Leptolyngbya sp. 15MV]|nr:hypothetical protein J4558_12450 [Leptolyngbya sp. 15MV]
MGVYLDVPYCTQLRFPNACSEDNDPTGCWYASACMIGWYFERPGRRTGARRGGGLGHRARLLLRPRPSQIGNQLGRRPAQPPSTGQLLRRVPLRGHPQRHRPAPEPALADHRPGAPQVGHGPRLRGSRQTLHPHPQGPQARRTLDRRPHAARTSRLR